MPQACSLAWSLRGRLGDGVPAARERCLAAVRCTGLPRCVAERDWAGEVGHRGLDERWLLWRGGPGWPGDEGGGEYRGADERCRTDPADLGEAGLELRRVGVGGA